MQLGPLSPARVTCMLFVLLILSPVPRMVMNVPPDLGPNAGSTPITVGAKTVNSDAPTTLTDPTPRCKKIVRFFKPGPLVNEVVTQIICIPGM